METYRRVFSQTEPWHIASSILHQVKGKTTGLDTRHGRYMDGSSHKFSNIMTYPQVNRLQCALKEYEQNRWQVVSKNFAGKCSAAECMARAKGLDNES